ncbi:hypothetical protein [Peristeroidobacter soli]|jgi:hypothetical protein|uniref:hypothetical protein n=1 Tax=Peristeroidobacter soli TaxID=2497877 RepID=UPI00101E0BF4|nr:hypothetical protein [Peristeroidobacter soli]
MNSLARSIIGAAVTAAAVYFLDPVNGRSRRVLLQDRARRAARRIDWSTRDLRRDASERYFASRPKAMFRPQPDRKVSRSVCGVIRQAVLHPESVHVAVDHGHVILRGHLQPHEHQRLLDEVRRQPGVFLVTDHLSEHRGNGEYAIDEGRAFRSARGASGWGITGRVLAGCAGGALVFWGIRERKALGEFGAAIAEEFQRAMERNLREGFDADDAKEAVDAAKEGAADVAEAAGRKVDEGMEWAESASSDVIEEYAQKRRRSNVGDATH